MNSNIAPGTRLKVAGCPSCAGSDRSGYNTVWVEDGGRMKPTWQRCPAKCTPASRAAAIERSEQLRAKRDAAAQAEALARAVESSRPAAPVSDPAPAPATSSAAAPSPAAQADAVDVAQGQAVRRAASPRPAPVYRGTPQRGAARSSAPRRTAARPTGPAPSAAAAASRWPAVALDAGEDGWLVDVGQVPVPAGPKLTDWMAWLGTGLPLRVDRVHPAGKGGDGVVCLSAAALKALALPAALPTTEKALAGLKTKLVKAAAAVGLELSEQVGPAFHVYRRRGAPGGPKTSVRVVVTPWLGQGSDAQQATTALLAELAADADGELDAGTLARRLRRFVADIGVAPGVTPATTSKLLLDAVRPRSEPVQDDEGNWSSQPREGALPGGDTAVPPAAGARHPLTRELLDEGLAVCEEEDFKWWARPLTETESALGWAVAVDVCASYLSVTMSLPLPAGPLERTTTPVFDGKAAGLWWCDFTGVAVDELLPHPATFHGQPPTDPGWYATPTVAYMAQAYGFDPATISEAFVASSTVPLLKEWTTRLREAYKRAYGVLGLPDGQESQTFLEAYATHKHVANGDIDRGDALVLAGLYKAVYKGGIGKWSDSARHLDDDT
ncbi:hypothetical protein V1J52_25440 [Streptomyces sp. TRM 70351]|uniref:hypothetical protein n=1 Tax=Streptomyces sp. TRM 70351 TaxID=3116552 RepID=UPI002E7C449E|nr:hypothetical protein [Streptomyces sp. TRM 70351]MEE1931466.1 hypothetical protein [Streptomyces sp. TRM 70351]